MRKKVELLAIFVLLILPLASAEIITSQPKDLYNLGDPLSLTTTITSSGGVNGFFSASLICNGKEQEFYKEYVFLSSGQEKKMTPSILLMKSIVQVSNGICKIKESFNRDYVLTKEFKLSDKLNIQVKNDKKEFLPGENIIFSGEVTKENGENANGIVELKIVSKEDANVEDLYETINNGYFGVNVTFDNKQKAGSYTVTIQAHEKDSDGEITNQGQANYEITIKQVPTNLEILLEKNEILPEEIIKARAIIHDQTGDNINARVNITFKDTINSTRLQEEHATDEFATLSISYNEAPGTWTTIATYDKFTSELPLTIKERIYAEFNLENNTLTVTNKGNVPYVKTISIKIGNETKHLNVSLEVGESKDFRITAPDGNYDIEVSGDGAPTLKKNVALKGNDFGIGPTGFATSLKDTSSSVIKIVKQPLAWLFIVLILGFTTFLMLRNSYKKNVFSGNNKNIPKIQSQEEKKIDPKSLQAGFPGLKNGAVLLLSLKGERQSTVAVCLKIKNPSEVKDPTGSAHEVLKKIVDRAEQRKAVFYESGDYLFLMFVPLKTKTFDNEKTSVLLADEINEMLKDYNRKFKQKVAYGISVHKGEIIAKDEQNILKFATLGGILTINKRYSTLANEEILISKEINDKVMSMIRSEKSNKEQGVYLLKEIKEKEEHKKFISKFIQRQKLEGSSPRREPEKKEFEVEKGDGYFDLGKL